VRELDLRIRKHKNFPPFCQFVELRDVHASPLTRQRLESFLDPSEILELRDYISELGNLFHKVKVF
jgi:hypothetical protein